MLKKLNFNPSHEYFNLLFLNLKYPEIKINPIRSEKIKFTSEQDEKAIGDFEIYKEGKLEELITNENLDEKLNEKKIKNNEFFRNILIYFPRHIKFQINSHIHDQDDYMIHLQISFDTYNRDNFKTDFKILMDIKEWDSIVLNKSKQEFGKNKIKNWIEKERESLINRIKIYSNEKYEELFENKYEKNINNDKIFLNPKLFLNSIICNYPENITIENVSLNRGHKNYILESKVSYISPSYKEFYTVLNISKKIEEEEIYEDNKKEIIKEIIIKNIQNNLNN